ncbi:major facilitator superfamily domain-containing protein 9 [Plakobranchus ocellatus]|uniref:Major facilitator superfamily domain-containing protein 9 n=1 Tax=Plakobranchus ocellatus TaxID=259542 RepID=A0AAV4AX79_9GAST|nr:major facilitator superfamily domain-containing protein 9 [Plakobranchus ocellatus]
MEGEKRFSMYILYFSGFLDLFAVSMIMPLILPQAIELGASPTLAGVLGSVYGGLQLVSSPIIGKWSDSVSRRFSLLVCMIFTGLGYTVLGLCSSVLAFFISRFILGCFKHSQTISRAFLSEEGCHQPSQRPLLLGNFNSFSSIGFIIGPAVGGHMAETSGGFSLVACTAAIVFAINAGLVWWMIPSEKTRPQTHRSPSDTNLTRSDTALSMEKVGSEELNLNFTKLFSSFRDFNWPQMWDLLLMRFFAGFSMIIFRTNFTMVLKLKFSASPSTIGYMTSFSGIVAALSGFCIGGITRRYNNDNSRLLFHSTIFQAIALMCLAIAPSLTVILLALVPLNLVTSLSRVSATTLTVEAAASGNKTSQAPGGKGKSASVGAVIGLGQSVMALARMSAPLVAGVAQEIAGLDSPSYIGAGSAAIAVTIMLCAGRTGEKRAADKKDN